MKLITIKEARGRLSIGRTKLWELSKKSDFPQLVQVTEGRKAYIEEELDAWIATRAAARSR